MEPIFRRRLKTDTRQIQMFIEHFATDALHHFLTIARVVGIDRVHQLHIGAQALCSLELIAALIAAAQHDSASGYHFTLFMFALVTHACDAPIAAQEASGTT